MNFGHRSGNHPVTSDHGSVICNNARELTLQLDDPHPGGTTDLNKVLSSEDVVQVGFGSSVGIIKSPYELFYIVLL